MGKAALVLLLAVGTFITACDNEFSPKTEFERKLVIFAALEPSQNMQVVRLAWSYDAELGVPPRPLTPVEVAEAQVIIRQGGTPYQFKDTLFTTAEGQPLRAWISRALIPKHETEHRLEVSVPGYGTITSSFTSPSRMYLAAEGVRADTGDGWVSLNSGVASYKVRPGAFYFRAWVVVKVREEGVLNERRVEIPTHVGELDKPETWTYPSPQREDKLLLDVRVIRQVAEALIGDADSVVTKQIVARGYVMNDQLYSYYKIVRGFDDPVSTRLDKPDISFIDGALGVFGAVLPDSATFLLSRFVK